MTLRYPKFLDKNFLVPDFLKMTLGVPKFSNKRLLGHFSIILALELLKITE